MLDPKLLQFFVEAADAASFSDAAARLNVSQSWLSRQVANLERQIGFKLFDRTSRSVVLTARGRDLLERARPAVQQVRGVQELAAKLGQRQLTLALGVPTYALLAEPRLALCDAFLQRYPRVNLETRIDGYRRLEAALVRGELDAAFAVKLPEMQVSTDLDLVTIARGGLDLVAPQGEPLAGSPSLSVDALAGRQVAAFAKRSNGALFSLIFEPAVRAGAQIIEFSDYSFHRRLADHGAVTVMPSWQPLPSPGLVRVPLEGAGGSIDLTCLRLQARGQPALERFWSLALRQAA